MTSKPVSVVVARKSNAVLRATATALTTLGFASTGLAVEFGITKSADTVIDSRGMTLDSSVAQYGIGINGNSFENNAITTYNGWQYTSYWVKDGGSYYVALARRQTGNASWQVANLGLSTFTNGMGSNSRPSDAHNVVSLGIDKIDGTLHLAYDLHGHTLKYRASQVGVATNPNAISAASWTSGTTDGTTALFKAQTGQLVSGTTVTGVTYPHFFNTNTGALQLTYRTGSSGNGSNWIGTYNGANQTWGGVHQIDNGATGTYTGTVTVADPNRNSYINGMTYGPSGRLYQSFTWREGATGAANHDIAFVYSDDNGNTWKNNAGTTVGTTGFNAQRWNINSPGLTVIPVDESQSLMNQQTQAVTSQDKFHTMMWHRDTAKANTGGVYRPTESSYFDYWRDGNGNWHRTKLPGQVGSRPKLFFDASDNAIAIYQLGSFDASGIYINNGDLVIAAATKGSNWTDWKIIKTEAGPFVSEAQADTSLLALNGTLSITMQDSPSLTSPAQATNMRALDYTFNITPATDRTYNPATGSTTGVWTASTAWGGTVPAGNANAIVTNGRSVTLNTAAAAIDNSIILGTSGTAGAMTLASGGSITVGANVIVGRDGGAVGTYTQTGGTLASNRFVVGDYYTETSSGGSSTASVTGGTLTTNELVVSAGGAASSGSSFTVGGSAEVTVNGEVLLGDLGSSATLAVNGGSLLVNGDIREGFNGNNSSLVRVNGGVLNTTGNAIKTDIVELNGGTIRNVQAVNTLNGTGGVITRTDAATTTLTINDGTFAGSIQNGNGVVSLNKVTNGTLTLGGASTYTGPTTLAAGVIRAQNGTALGTTAGNTTIGSTASLRLELAGNISIAEPLVLGGRQPGVTAAHLTNAGGTNTFSGSINTAAGGNQYNISSDAGKLTVTGNFINNGTGGATDIRFLNLAGAADGEWQSVLANNGTAATTAVTKSGTGTWTLTGGNTYSGTTTVSAGTLRATNLAIGNLLLNTGGVDLGDGTLVLNYTGGTSPAGVVKAKLMQAYASGFSTGQIRSTTIAADETIGYGDDGSNVTVRVTLPGDADLNGQVDFNDFLALQNNFGNTNTRFDQGNFNYDTTTDFNDFLALQNYFGQSVSGDAVTFTDAQVAALTAFAASPLNQAVPEPASLTLMGLGVAGLLRRRR